MTMELQGKIALVTGGAIGLGHATASAFLREGASVVINDVNETAAKASADKLGAKCSAVGGDVSKKDAVEAMVAAVLERHGRIDILVNNAGLSDVFVPTIDQDLAHWQRLIDVHLTGTYLVSKTAARSMLEQKSGVVLNLSSVGGILGLPVRTAYSAAKAGITMMTRTLAGEWGPRNVRVNAVAPGYMLTPMTEKLIADGKVDVDRVRRRTPMGKWGTAEDVADAMVFLASERAKFITGVVLPVDGGYCSWGAPSDAYDIEANG
jgi:NAD(P)-dependent dehydrogenase (short-subunit alcohol dehydrogenase family)